MPNDKKNNTKNDDQVMSLSNEDSILDEQEETAKEEAIEELSDDVKEALGLEEDTKTKKDALKTPVEDLDYISEDVKDALNEIDNLM